MDRPLLVRGLDAGAHVGRRRPRLAPSLLAAPVTTLFGVVAFGGIHAAWIVPIWDRLAGGLPFALAVAIGMAWISGEIQTQRDMRLAGWRLGALLGVGLWLTLVPATLTSALARWTGLHASHASWVDASSLVVTAVTAAAAMSRLQLDALGIVAGTVAAMVTLLAQGGPVAVPLGQRATGFFLLLAPLYAVGGAAHVVATALVERWRIPSLACGPATRE